MTVKTKGIASKAVPFLFPLVAGAGFKGNEIRQMSQG